MSGKWLINYNWWVRVSENRVRKILPKRTNIRVGLDTELVVANHVKRPDIDRIVINNVLRPTSSSGVLASSCSFSSSLFNSLSCKNKSNIKRERVGRL